MIRGMIFDFDGTLFDSMYVWDLAGGTYLRSVGREPEDDLQSVLKPMSLFQSAEYLREHYNLSFPVETVMDGINRTVENFYFHTVEPKPGVIPFLEQLAGKNVRMCIATATARYQVEAALARWGMNRFFSGIFTCTEVGAGKDQPLIFRRSMEHLGTDRRDTLVVEDAWHAIQTAKADGFLVAAVYDSHEPMQARVREAADVYLKDFLDTESFWKFASAE